MEGIHALNPLILKGIDASKVFRIYISVRTKFMKGDEEIISPAELRLIRRMVRDNLYRGHAPHKTIEYWHHVLASEKKHIDPFRDDVEYKIDSTLDYEVCTWHGLLRDLMEEEDFTQYQIMKHVIDGLLQFHKLELELIPEDSLLREFIG